MQSPNRAHLSTVDELRGLAALLVFFFHANILEFWQTGHAGWPRARDPLMALIYEGHMGVALFMVLSGFILAKGVFGQHVSYGGFLRNRLLRIMPLMMVMAVFAVYGAGTVSLGEIVAPFLLLQNVPPLALKDPAGFTGVLWTISTEFQFYLVAPWLFVFVGRDGIRRFLVPALVFFLAMRLLMMAPHRAHPETLWSLPYFSLAGRMNQFLIGIGLAYLWPDLEARSSAPQGRFLGPGLLLIGSLAAIFMAFAVNWGGGQYAWHTWRYLHQDIEAAIWAIFIAGYVLVRPLSRVDKLQRLVASIGLISFSLYLLHWPVLAFMLREWPAHGLALPQSRAMTLVWATTCVLPLVLALSTLSYWVVERPFLQARVRYLSSSPPP